MSAFDDNHSPNDTDSNHEASSEDNQQAAESRSGVGEEEVFCDDFDDASEFYSSRLEELENEQEQLNSSLISLTSHFAQVQLRLKQIVDAAPDEKEQLLKELEEFAFRAIPDLREPQIHFEPGQLLDNDVDNGVVDKCDADNNLTPSKKTGDVSKLEQQRIKQKELIQKLKDQLEDLEKYAYETGDHSSIPSSMLLERQSVIIEQLKGRLPLNLDEMDKLSPEDLRRHVDKAIRDVS